MRWYGAGLIKVFGGGGIDPIIDMSQDRVIGCFATCCELVPEVGPIWHRFGAELV